ncbi:hypothetical protein RCL1_005394 [Eukaryota sp. TZLM3-RCL]
MYRDNNHFLVHQSTQKYGIVSLSSSVLNASLFHCSFTTFFKLRCVSRAVANLIEARIIDATHLELPDTYLKDKIVTWLPKVLLKCQQLEFLTLPQRFLRLAPFIHPADYPLFSQNPNLKLRFRDCAGVSPHFPLSSVCESLVWDSSCTFEQLSSSAPLSSRNTSLLCDFSFAFPYVDVPEWLSNQPAVLHTLGVKKCPSSRIASLLHSASNQPLKALKIDFQSFSRWPASTDFALVPHLDAATRDSLVSEANVILNFPDLEVFECPVSFESPLFSLLNLTRLRVLKRVEISAHCEDLDLLSSLENIEQLALAIEPDNSNDCNFLAESLFPILEKLPKLHTLWLDLGGKWLPHFPKNCEVVTVKHGHITRQTNLKHVHYSMNLEYCQIENGFFDCVNVDTKVYLHHCEVIQRELLLN